MKTLQWINSKGGPTAAGILLFCFLVGAPCIATSEWSVEDPKRGQAVLGILMLLVTAAILWFGSKHRLASILVALVFFLLAATAIPSMIPARAVSQKNACISNLHWIQEGKRKWAEENKKSSSDIPSEEDLYGAKEGEGYIRHHQICPRGGIYTIGAVGQEPVCSLANKGHKISEPKKME